MLCDLDAEQNRRDKAGEKHDRITVTFGISAADKVCLTSTMYLIMMLTILSDERYAPSWRLEGYCPVQNLCEGQSY